MNSPRQKRTDRASRIVRASPSATYAALVDPEALISWLPPKGMRGEIQAFEPRSGGAYHLTLIYEAEEHARSGKTSAGTDVVRGRFLELVADRRIVQQVEFEADDPAFAGAMTITWLLATAPGGTEVTVVCDNVPDGISKEAHDAGLRSTLENLAAFVET